MSAQHSALPEGVVELMIHYVYQGYLEMTGH